jgi:NitT/TauT family transport system ATP-binding protein
MVQEEVAMTTSLVSLKNVSKNYETLTGEIIEAIKNVSFELYQGEVLGLVGPSGCGKSTILKMISGVETPSTGTIDQRKEEGENFIVGFIFQDSSLMRWRSVYDNIKLPLEVMGKKNVEKIAELIKTVNLTGFERAYPIELSGGMQRRVAIARALVHEPSVLLMDEPFTGVDEITKEVLQTELNFVIRKLNVTAVLVTHDIEEAVFLADRVLVISDRPGTILQEVSVPLPKMREPVIRSEKKYLDCCVAIRERLNLLHPLRTRET